MLKNIPSDAVESFRASELSIQSHAPVRLPAVSTWPGQLPTLKWKPVFNNGPAGLDTNSTNICCDVPMLNTLMWTIVIAFDLNLFAFFWFYWISFECSLEFVPIIFFSFRFGIFYQVAKFWKNPIEIKDNSRNIFIFIDSPMMLYGNLPTPQNLPINGACSSRPS